MMTLNFFGEPIGDREFITVQCHPVDACRLTGRCWNHSAWMSTPFETGSIVDLPNPTWEDIEKSKERARQINLGIYNNPKIKPHFLMFIHDELWY